jgi:hypothetical protein
MTRFRIVKLQIIIPSFSQQLTKYFIMCPLYSRHVSALILGHHQVNLSVLLLDQWRQRDYDMQGVQTMNMYTERWYSGKSLGSCHCEVSGSILGWNTWPWPILLRFIKNNRLILETLIDRLLYTNIVTFSGTLKVITMFAPATTESYPKLK